MDNNYKQEFLDWCDEQGVPERVSGLLAMVWGGEKHSWKHFQRAPLDQGFVTVVEYLLSIGVITELAANGLVKHAKASGYAGKGAGKIKEAEDRPRHSDRVRQRRGGREAGSRDERRPRHGVQRDEEDDERDEDERDERDQRKNQGDGRKAGSPSNLREMMLARMRATQGGKARNDEDDDDDRQPQGRRGGGSALEYARRSFGARGGKPKGGLLRKVLPGMPEFVYNPALWGILIAILLVGALLVFFAMSGGGQSTTFYDGGTSGSGGTGTGNGLWFQSQGASAKGGYSFLAHPAINELNKWIADPPWVFLSFILLTSFALLVAIQERFLENDATDVKIVLISLGVYFGLFIVAEVVKWASPQFYLDPLFWVFGHLFAFFLNFGGQFFASLSGDWDATPLAVGGLFIPGVTMVAWWNTDPLLSNLGIALIIAAILLEIVEIHMSRGGFGAVIVGAVIVPLFVVITLVSYFALSALMKGVPPPPANWDKALTSIVTGLLAWAYGWRVILSGAIGASLAIMLGEAVALIFVPALKLGQGRVGAQQYRAAASESARSDAVILSVMFCYVLAIIGGAIISALV